MRPARLLLIYFAAVFLGGALVAPWLYFVAQAAGPQAGWAAGLAAHPFHRFVDRALLGIALLGIWPLLRGGGMASWRQLGVAAFKPHASEAARGVVIGLATIVILGAAALLCGGREAAAGAGMCGVILAARRWRR